MNVNPPFSQMPQTIKEIPCLFIMKKNLLEEVTIPVTLGSNLESCNIFPACGFCQRREKVLIEVATVTIIEDYGVGGV